MNIKRKALFATKASALLSLTVVLLLLLTTVVHACLGLKLPQMASRQVTVSHETVETGPCSDDKKEDICKYIRDRMLAVHSSAFQAADVQLLALISSQIAVNSNVPSILLVEALDLKSFYGPVLKLPLPIAFPLLRI